MIGSTEAIISIIYYFIKGIIVARKLTIKTSNPWLGLYVSLSGYGVYYLMYDYYQFMSQFDEMLLGFTATWIIADLFSTFLAYGMVVSTRRNKTKNYTLTGWKLLIIDSIRLLFLVLMSNILFGF